MKTIITILFFAFIFYACSCSEEKEENLDRRVIITKVLQGDKEAQAIENKLADIPISCDYYGEGCLNVYKAMVISYEVLFIEFSSSEFAQKEALKKKKMRYHNWLVDNVNNEKILVEFFEKYLESKYERPEHHPFKQ